MHELQHAAPIKISLEASFSRLKAERSRPAAAAQPSPAAELELFTKLPPPPPAGRPLVEIFEETVTEETAGVSSEVAEQEEECWQSVMRGEEAAEAPEEKEAAEPEAPADLPGPSDDAGPKEDVRVVKLVPEVAEDTQAAVEEEEEEVEPVVMEQRVIKRVQLREDGKGPRLLECAHCTPDTLCTVCALQRPVSRAGRVLRQEASRRRGSGEGGEGKVEERKAEERKERKAEERKKSKEEERKVRKRDEDKTEKRKRSLERPPSSSYLDSVLQGGRMRSDQESGRSSTRMTSADAWLHDRSSDTGRKSPPSKRLVPRMIISNMSIPQDSVHRHPGPGLRGAGRGGEGPGGQQGGRGGG
jgi:hypothetical protein